MFMSNQQKKVAPKLTKVQLEQIAALPTTSAKIRYLNKEGYPRADIARILNKRYQHIKNVLDAPTSN